MKNIIFLAIGLSSLISFLSSAEIALNENKIEMICTKHTLTKSIDVPLSFSPGEGTKFITLPDNVTIIVQLTDDNNSQVGFYDIKLMKAIGNDIIATAKSVPLSLPGEPKSHGLHIFNVHPKVPAIFCGI